jgi:hypothetical protein
VTEAEWLACDYPCAMLEALYNHPHRDKFRLLACLWCLSPEVRRLLETQRATRFLASAEQFVAGRITCEELLEAVRAAPRSWKSGGPWRSPNPVRLAPAAQALRAVAALAASDPWEAAWGVAQEAVNLLGPADCELIRELFGNPMSAAGSREGTAVESNDLGRGPEKGRESL